MPLTNDQLESLTDEQLNAIAETPAWDDRVYKFRDKDRARIILNERFESRIRRGVEIGDEIEFVRYGRPPAGGASRNHRDGFREDGVSVYLLSGGEVVLVGWYFDIVKRPAYRGRGVVVGWGSDGEPLVRVSRALRDKSFDRTED